MRHSITLKGSSLALGAIIAMVPQIAYGQSRVVTNVAQSTWDAAGGPRTVNSNRVDVVVAVPAQPITAGIYRISSDPVGRATTIDASGCTVGGNTWAGPAGPEPRLTSEDRFTAGESVAFGVQSANDNLDPTARETLSVTIRTDSGDEETLLLREDAVNSGFFVGYLGTHRMPPAPVAGDCRLGVAPGTSTAFTMTRSGTPTVLSRASADFLIDPFGIVFDSGDGSPVTAVRVTLINADTGAPAQVFGDDGQSAYPSTMLTGSSVTDSGGTVYNFPAGDYRFPLVAPGRYRLLVEPAAPYTAPSRATAAELAALRRPDDGLPFNINTASYGAVFTLFSPEPVRIDVPLDRPGNALILTKSTQTQIGVPGDVVRYRIQVRNGDSQRTTGAVTITDVLPAQMRLRSTSVRYNGTLIAANVDPDGRHFAVTVPALAAGSSGELTYLAEIRTDAAPGDALNMASARDARGTSSNVADAAVRIRRDVLGDRITIIGRVTRGGCAVDAQEGVPGVRIMLQDGSFSITDIDGRYHFEGVRPGTHVVQMDDSSLPPGDVPADCMRHTRSAGSAISRFVDGRGGELRRADFYVRTDPDAIANRRAAVAAPERPAVAEASVAAGSDRNWFDGQSAGIEWLFPAPEHNPRSSAVRIAIKHLPGQRVELSLNGSAVDPLNFDGSQNAPNGQFAVSQWRGVDIHDGDNRFVARVLNSDGSLAQELVRVVHYSTGPLSVQLLRERSLLIADGITRPVVAARLTDRDGRPIRSGMVGDFDIAAPHRAATEIDAEQARQLSGLERASPSWRVLGDDGVAYIELAPTTASGSARISFTFRDREVTRRQDIDLWLNPGDRPWTIVGFAAGTVGYNTLDDRMEPVAEDLPADNLDGRVALYAKGRILGQWLMTMAYDSDREADDTRFGGVIDPRAYYTIYADRADRGFDAASVRNLYLRLERPQFYALFGDFETGLNQTELTRYQRAMNGVRAEYRGPNLSANAFVADTPYRHRHEEMQGNGLSGPYALGARDILANSEQISIEVRDRLRPDLVIDRRSLVRHIDYDIDYFAGTLRFREPILSRDSSLNPQFIVADYEVDGVGQRVTNAGGRVAYSTNDDRLRVGASFIHDEDLRGQTNMGGVDLRVRPTASTEVRAEFAQSRITAAAGSTPPANPRANAWLVEAEHHGPTFDLLAYARHQDDGFGVGQLTASANGSRRIGFDGRLRIADSFSLIGSAWHEERLNSGSTRRAAQFVGEWRTEAGSLRAGLIHADDSLGNGDRNRSTLLQLGGSRRLLGGRLEVDGQTEIAIDGADDSVDFPRRHRLGARYTLNDSAMLVGAYEMAQGGQLDTRTARLGIDVRPWAGARLSASGNQQQINEYGARSFAAYGLSQGFRITEQLSFDVTVDGQRTLGGVSAAELINPEHPIASGGHQGVEGLITEDFVAMTLGATWRSEDWSLTGRAEYRDGELTNRGGMTIAALRRIGEGRAFGGLFSWTSARAVTGLRSDVTNLELSWANRPASSRWSWLNKVEMRIDQIENAVAGAPGPIGGPLLAIDGNARSARLINSLSINYTPHARDDGGLLRENGEYALFWGVRYASDRIGLDDVAGWSTVVGADVRFDLSEMVSVGGAGNVRLGTGGRTVSWSGGPQIVLAPFDNANLIVGYNLAGFSDRDFEDSRYSRGGLYATIRVKFDQNLLAGLFGTR